MNEQNRHRRTSPNKRFYRAMVDSSNLLTEYFDGVDFSIKNQDFFLYELGKLVQERNTSFKNDEFRLLIEQGLRLTVDPDIMVRSKLVRSLRRGYQTMSPNARRIVPDVIGAIEDSDFSLNHIGAVVLAYTNRLFAELEDMTNTSSIEDAARVRIESWKGGSLNLFELTEDLRDLGTQSVAPVADMLFESINNPATVDTSLELLSMLKSPLAARVLAYIVSEPMLEETQEERAYAILKEFWPLPKTYILYRLKQHSHEDIPFRWIELLIEMEDLRAIDRILEEVVAHARSENHKEDLLAILDLMNGSKDPGIVGKILRLLTAETAPEAPLDFVQEWLKTTRLGEPVEEALNRWNKEKTILVPAAEDFSLYASHKPQCSLEQLREDWNSAYHESLGWQQRKALTRGPIEQELEYDLEEAMMRKLSLNPRLDDIALYDQIKSFREQWLVTPRENFIPLVAIYLERPRENPWSEDIYWREINEWYVRAAQYFDEGSLIRARQLLDIVLQIEPNYPLARMLDEVMNETGPGVKN